jgi:hypothetical protein
MIHPATPPAFLTGKQNRRVAVWMVLDATAAGLAVQFFLLFDVFFVISVHISHITHD